MTLILFTSVRVTLCTRIFSKITQKVFVLPSETCIQPQKPAAVTHIVKNFKGTQTFFFCSIFLKYIHITNTS